MWRALGLVLLVGCGATPRRVIPACNGGMAGLPVAVLGAVARPGKHAATTLGDAITSAGGVTVLGVRRYIVLRRVTPQGSRRFVLDLDRESHEPLCGDDELRVYERD